MINVSKTVATKKQVPVVCTIDNVSERLMKHLNEGYTYVAQIMMPVEHDQMILIFNVPEPVEKKPIVSKPWR